MKLNLNLRVLIRLNFLFIVTLTGLTFPVINLTSGAESVPTIGHLKAFEDEFYDLVPKDAIIEVLGSGFDWSEGPLWIPKAEEGFLIFSDIPRN